MINKTFRVFVSSTFQDFLTEREIINNKLSAEIEAYCRKKGYSVQFVDLRWGISAEAASNQKTMPICLGEVDRCNRLSPRPNFIAMIGNRYGWVPLPYAIKETEFKIIDAAVCKHDKYILNRWYKLDENAAIPEYVLIPRAGRYIDNDIWSAEESVLRDIFQDVVSKNIIQGNAVDKYVKSATEQEIIEGLLNNKKSALDTITIFKKLESGEDTKSIAEIKKRIECKYREDSAEDNLIYIDRDEIYEETFEKELFNALKKNIDREIDRLERTETDLTEERKHIGFAHDKSENYIKSNGFNEVKNYILSECETGFNEPMYVIGPSGTGKSTLLAKAACEHENECICRFSGATYESMTLFEILNSVISDIRGRYEFGFDSNVSKKNLSDKFEETLYLVPDNEKLIIILDGIDVCTDISEYNENVFPLSIPGNVKLIISSTPDCRLTGMGKRIHIRYMDEYTGWLLFKQTLEKNNRRIRNGRQVQHIKDIIKGKHSAIYIYILALICTDLRSFDEMPEISGDEDQICSEIVTHICVKRGHSKNIVLKVLSLIAFAPFGLTESEIQELLYRDEKIFREINDFYKLNNSCIGRERIPYVIWSRLFFDLDGFLTYMDDEGQSVIRFSHGSFSALIENKYKECYSEAALAVTSFFKEQSFFVDKEKLLPNKRRAKNYLNCISKKNDWTAIEKFVNDWRELDTIIRIGKVDFLCHTLLELYYDRMNDYCKKIIVLIYENKSFLLCFPDRFMQVLMQNGYEIHNNSSEYWFFYDTTHKTEKHGGLRGQYVPNNIKGFTWNMNSEMYAYIFSNSVFCHDYKNDKEICKVNLHRIKNVKIEPEILIWISEDSLIICCSGGEIYSCRIGEIPEVKNIMTVKNYKSIKYNPVYNLIAIVTKNEIIVADRYGTTKKIIMQENAAISWSHDKKDLFIISENCIYKIELKTMKETCQGYNNRFLKRAVKQNSELREVGKEVFFCIDKAVGFDININTLQYVSLYGKYCRYFNIPNTEKVNEIIFSPGYIVIAYTDSIIAYDLKNMCCKRIIVNNCHNLCWNIEGVSISYVVENNLYCISLKSLTDIKNIDVNILLSKTSRMGITFQKRGGSLDIIANLFKLLKILCMRHNDIFLSYKILFQTLFQEHWSLKQSKYLEAPTCMATSADGNKAFAFEWQDKIIVIDKENNEIFRIVNLKFSLADGLYNLKFSPCGKYLAVIRTLSISVYHVNSGARVFCLKTLRKPVLHIDFIEADRGIIIKLIDKKEYKVLFREKRKISSKLFPRDLGYRTLGLPFFYTQDRNDEEYPYRSLLECSDSEIWNRPVYEWFTHERCIFQHAIRSENESCSNTEEDYWFISFYKNNLYYSDLSNGLIKSNDYDYIMAEQILLEHDTSEAATFMRRKSELSSEVIVINEPFCILICKALNCNFAIDLYKDEVVAVEQFKRNIIGFDVDYENGAIVIYTNDGVKHNCILYGVNNKNE